MIDVGIDPGVPALGYAIAWGRQIGAAGLCRPPRTVGKPCLDVRGMGYADEIRDAISAQRGGPWQVTAYVESMTVTRDRTTTPQDLINVQTIGCIVAGRLGDVRLLPPDTWKGSTPKAIHHERLCALDGPLDASERAIVAAALRATPKKHHKEVLDAVGILLYGLGRTERNGTRRQ